MDLTLKALGFLVRDTQPVSLSLNLWHFGYTLDHAAALSFAASD
jgi:hypothetical protein